MVMNDIEIHPSMVERIKDNADLSLDEMYELYNHDFTEYEILDAWMRGRSNMYIYD